MTSPSIFVTDHYPAFIHMKRMYLGIIGLLFLVTMSLPPAAAWAEGVHLDNAAPMATVTNGQCSASNMASGTINLTLSDPMETR
jgi:hypothetical protein